MGVWDEEEKASFKNKLGEVEMRDGKVQKEVETMESRIIEAMERTEEEKEGRIREVKGWLDIECKERKKEVRRELRAWRKRWRDVQEYRNRKRENKELCKRKKREEMERWIRAAERVQTEGQIWEIVKRERRICKCVSREITLGEWRNYLMGLIGGMDKRVLRGDGGRRRIDGEEIGKEEIRRVIRSLRDGKAIRVDSQMRPGNIIRRERNGGLDMEGM